MQKGLSLQHCQSAETSAVKAAVLALISALNCPWWWFKPSGSFLCLLSTFSVLIESFTPV